MILLYKLGAAAWREWDARNPSRNQNPFCLCNFSRNISAPSQQRLSFLSSPHWKEYWKGFQSTCESSIKSRGSGLPAVIPAAFHHMEEGKLFGGVDGEGADGDGGGGRSREARQTRPLLSHGDRDQLPHLQTLQQQTYSFPVCSLAMKWWFESLSTVWKILSGMYDYVQKYSELSVKSSDQSVMSR